MEGAAGIKGANQVRSSWMPRNTQCDHRVLTREEGGRGALEGGQEDTERCSNAGSQQEGGARKPTDPGGHWRLEPNSQESLREAGP